MRVVIVEDEPNTRNGIIKIIEKYTPHEVIAGESDGEAGLEKVLSLRPDVVITDINMPRMDGLTMINRIREAGVMTAAILLTGYSEFEYAQRAIQLSVAEYLLKPLDVEDIIEILGTVEKKISKNKVEKVSAEQLLFSLLTGDGNDEEMVQRQLAERIRNQKDQDISMFLIQSESILEDTTNLMAEVLKDSLDAICLTGFFIFKLPYEKQILVMISDGQNARYLKAIFKTRILKELKKKGEFLISYGELKSLSGLKDTLRQMQEYLSYTFVFPDSRIMDMELVRNLSFEKVEYPEYLERGIKRDIKNGNKEGIRKCARKFEEAVIQSREEPKTVKNHTVRFVMAVLNTARDLMKNKDIEALYQYLLNDMMKTSIREIFLNNYWKMMDMVADDREKNELTGNGMILNVIEFIRLNYDKEISLSDAADLVGITPEYLSKLFTREMGINFCTFLGEFRVSIAKKLLATGNYKIHEVAEMVGYKDTKYFNKVFRSIMGVSPSDYRKVF
ncbi:response regulator transcription factor [Lacrimispora brassicae]